MNDSRNVVASNFENSGDSYCYSLIDSAQIHDFKIKTIPYINQNQLVSLLGESPEVNESFAGPLLLTHLQKQQCKALAWIISKVEECPFASFIVTSLALDELVLKLSWLTSIKHDDGTEWVMRFYDPRILPHWFNVLSAEQKSIVLSFFDKWIYQDASGIWQLINGTNKQLDVDVENTLIFSAEQHELLMQKCLPYMVQSLLEDDGNEDMLAMNPHSKYVFLHKHIVKAQSYKLDSMLDLKTYCMLALMFDDNFDSRPEVKLAIHSGKFSEQVLQWSANQWSSITKRTVTHDE